MYHTFDFWKKPVYFIIILLAYKTFFSEIDSTDLQLSWNCYLILMLWFLISSILYVQNSSDAMCSWTIATDRPSNFEVRDAGLSSKGPLEGPEVLLNSVSWSSMLNKELPCHKSVNLTRFNEKKNQICIL